MTISMNAKTIALIAGAATIVAGTVYLYKHLKNKKAAATVGLDVVVPTETDTPVDETVTEAPTKTVTPEPSIVREPVKPDLELEVVGGWILKALAELNYHESDFIPLSDRVNVKISERVAKLNPDIDKDFIYRILKDSNIISLQVFFSPAAQQYGMPETLTLNEL